MNSRLFWKIFLPFWLLQTALMLFLAYYVHESFGPQRPWWLQPERRAMPVIGRAAIHRYQRGQRDGLRDMLQDIELPQRSQYWLLDDQGNELSGRAMSSEVHAAVAEAVTGGGMSHVKGATILALRMQDRDNRMFVFAGEFSVPPLIHSLPGGLVAGILISSLLTSLLCMELARYLTSPILRLRDAAHAIAHGNLEARAGRKGSRRRDEIADVVADFDAMAVEIANLVDSNRRMLVGVSHDLRSPIARIRVALSLVSNAPENERAELLERIEQELLRLNSMIEQVLTVARLESGQMRAQCAPVSLNQVIDEAVEDARFEASQSDVEIVYDDRWPETVLEGDENMLRSAIENVLRNAIFYSSQAGRVELNVAVRNGRVRVVVRDNGPGAPEEAVSKLFEPFYRVDDARGVTTGGCGLGLSLTAGAVRAHQGTVRASNIAPHGLEIAIELPVAHVVALPPAETAGSSGDGR